MIHFKRQLSKKTKAVLALASALLLSISWWGASCITLFVGLVPLLLISAQYNSSWRDTFSMLGWATLTFVLWNVSTVWWIWNATPVGPIAATVVSTWWSLVAFMLYHIVSKHAPKALAYTVFIAAWLATEYIYVEAPALSFPWLILGNGFADDTWAVQWYEYTGVFGGSLWVLAVNILAFDALLTMRKRAWMRATLALAVPLGISIALYYHNDVENERYTSLDKVTVSVVQPNISCYEKFKTDPQWQQNHLMSLLAEAPDSAEFVLFPETALAENINDKAPETAFITRRISEYLGAEKPTTMVVSGGETVRSYGTLRGSQTARKRGLHYYDLYNSSLGIDSTSKVQIHHKGKLVVGVETIPMWLRKAGNMFAIDLGGTFGQLGIGAEQIPFEHNGKKVAPAICYEGLYGNHMAEFVRNGAEALFVVSNDGWWGNTPGHRYLFKFCRLRAIELRRDIARSANTGVSGFINMLGEDGSRLEWEEQGVLTSDIRLNSRKTFYAKYGDYIGRLSLYIAALCLLYFIAYLAKKRFYLN
ncbi:MAG: apolipoprotein N-acyltransferase [Alistipes sp.]|nr:apolipoprotein N-acyltransferase [Alistipes sp.]